MAARLADENHRLAAAIFKSVSCADARRTFLRIARDAEQAGLAHHAVLAWNNAGGCSLATLHFRDALDELSHSREIAEKSGDFEDAAKASSNIASLHIQMGNFEAALRIADEAASQKPAPDANTIATLNAQRAIALASLRRLDEARPLFRASMSGLDDLGDWGAEVRTRGVYGRLLLDAGDLDEAEPILTEALRLARLNHVPATNVLRSLAVLRAAQGDSGSAAHLFESALAEPPGPTPRWVIYADRGEFRLDQGDAEAALSDFREARRLAAEMRADIVPADEDRVTLEAGLGRIAAGIINADNQLALNTNDYDRMRESFDVAEQDRQWSLRALVPEPDDWRTRLPAEYWDLLAQYQALERSLGSRTSGPMAERAGALALRLQLIEAASGGARDGRVLSAGGPAASVLEPAQARMADDAVLFSFYTTKRKSWLWAITRDRFDVYPIPSSALLRTAIESFVASLRSGAPDSTARGREVYSALFGQVAGRYATKPKWLLELDGPLYNLPFSALVVNPPGQPPVWLLERASTEIIPGALMIETSAPAYSGPFVGVADPVYNAADGRYRGRRPRADMALTRLPNTDKEVKTCALAWGSRSLVLTGMGAGSAAVEKALASQPSIIHFATHVVPGAGDYGSGLIVLSLDRKGFPALLGPRQILARPAKADLVVLDGCDSAQGSALPGAGLMGLTRAWIGAGAHAVLATLWDIPDDSQSVLPAFYRYLRAHRELGPAEALRAAQLDMLSTSRGHPEAWAGYFLLARR